MLANKGTKLSLTGQKYIIQHSMKQVIRYLSKHEIIVRTSQNQWRLAGADLLDTLDRRSAFRINTGHEILAKQFNRFGITQSATCLLFNLNEYMDQQCLKKVSNSLLFHKRRSILGSKNKDDFIFY